MYALLRGFMRLMVRVYLAGLFRVDGLENVPSEGGLIVCPNHTSTVDPPLVPAFLSRTDSWSMAKAEYFARPGIGRWMFTAYHSFPVVRHSPDRGALRRAMEILRSGQVLVVYPEGTRVESAGLVAGEPGAAYLAQRLDVRVLPVALVGTRECFPKGARWPRRVPVSMRVGRPFRLPLEVGGRRVPAEEAVEAVMLSIAELLPESDRGRYSDLEALRARVGGLRLYDAPE